MSNLERWQRALALYGVIKQLVLIVQDLIPGKEQGGESGRGEERLERFFELFEAAAQDIGEKVEEIRPQVVQVVKWVVSIYTRLDMWGRALAETFRKA